MISVISGDECFTSLDNEGYTTLLFYSKLVWTMSKDMGRFLKLTDNSIIFYFLK